MSPEDEVVETIEHAICRQRTDDEQLAVEQSTLFRALINAGAQQMWVDLDLD